MADYTEVVEMWRNNFASLLELAKKWLVEWKIDFKKLLHMLQNIRKEDLLGLIAGTHEVKIKKLETNLVEKFVMFADLGEVIVPDDFDPKTWLASFSKKNRNKFYFYDDAITDTNPDCILKPGDKLHVRIFKQNISGNTTSEERMEFLATQNAVYTGAQGASIVWEQKCGMLPKGYWYCSFDEKEQSGKVNAGSDGYFRFQLGFFNGAWRSYHCILCFNEVTD